MNRIIILKFFSMEIFTFSLVFGNSISQPKCNKSQSIFPPMSKTFNDTDAAPKEFPFMAKIYNDNGAISNGLLISKNFVLTIANNSTAYHVILGDFDHLNRFKVINEIRHPEFNLHPSHTIKLLKLNESVQFDEYVRPACFSQPKSIVSQRLFEIGWSDETLDNNRLHKVKLIFISNTTCKRERATGCYSELYTRGIDAGTFCAAVENGDRDMCSKVDGSALLNDDNEIVGIASENIGCGEGHPQLFLRVSEYMSWIESVVRPRGNKLVERTTDIVETETVASVVTHNEDEVIETSEVETSVATTSMLNVTQGPTDRIITPSSESSDAGETRKIIVIVMLVIVFILLCVCGILLLCIQKYEAKNRRSAKV